MGLGVVWDDSIYTRLTPGRPAQSANLSQVTGRDPQNYYVVCYENLPNIKGCDEFLVLPLDGKPGFCSEVGQASFFSTVREAVAAAVHTPDCDDAHGEAKVLKAERISRWELSEL